MCPVCRANHLLDHEELAECHVCGHICQKDMKVTAQYGRPYLDRYLAYPLVPMTCLRMGFIKAHIEGGRLLDVGYGRGDLVKMASEAGFDAYGNDIHGVDYGVREVALDADRSWDVVTFFDSLEHFSDLDGVRALAERARIVIVSLPQTPPRFPSDRNWRHYRPGEHLHYFSVNSLKALFPNHRLWCCSNLEDVVRKGVPGEPNILTVSFVSE